MTENEWRTCDDPVAMLKAARCRTRHRKLRLFAAACCRLNWHLLPDGRSRAAVEVAERHADGEACEEELRAAADAARAAHQEAFDALGKQKACVTWAAVYVAWPVAYGAARNASWMAAHAELVGAHAAAQAEVVRDLIPEPSRSLPPLAASMLGWGGGLIARLAQAAYDERLLPSGCLDLARLAVLADALEDAGCFDPAILSHLRSPGPHVRGCWAIDLILGLE